jgi:hypothetical protein
MQRERERAHATGVVAGVTIGVRQRGPVLSADGVGLDEEVIPVLLGVTVHPERQLPALRRDVDGVGEALVGRVSRLRDRELLAGTRRRTGVEVGIDRVPITQPAGAVGADLELADVDRRQVGRHRVRRVPHPRRPAMLGAAVAQNAVSDHLQPRGHRDTELVGRLIERVVVDRVPARRSVRLPRDHRAVIRVEEARLAERGIHIGLRHAVVGDRNDEALVSP